ncbi:MAG: HAMP domain-containing histidine kinase [Oscillospiraceae bacterium]|nr:HAMP domain-containing histidine kinase [Oscillospiraceae bacterium]
MIKRLRWKLVGITAVLLTVLLGLILGFVYYSTGASLRDGSLERLEEMGMQYIRPGGPHKRPGQGKVDGCFLIQVQPDGTFLAAGQEYLITDSQQLEEIIEEAQADGQRSGVLEDRQLRYIELDDGPGVAYAFMDISSELHTLSGLATTCVIIFLVGVVMSFFISVFLARWATRPVEQAWDQQRQFVADASHELKTPLTVILTNAELLAQEDTGEQDRARFASSILVMSRQMRGLVEELLDQARVDNDAVRAEWTSVDLSKLVSDAVLPFEPVYFEAGKSLDSQIQPGIRVTGSPRHLRQVVEILLDNGCKYSSPDAAVVLRLERYHRGCMISVTSPGTALTQQQCVDIFKRFYRVDSARKMDRSYGLGLSIAKSIVEQHKGRIWAQSQLGENTFFVQLSS